MSDETEIRLATTAAAAATLWRSAALRQFTVSHRRSRELRSVYWDTPDFRLRDHGLTLRVRRTDDGHSVQTLKTPAQHVDTRREYEAPLEGTQPDLALAQRHGWRGGGHVVANAPALRPIFETRIVRTSCDVRFDDGTVAELALDRGRIVIDSRRPVASERVLEIEIEFMSGRPSTPYELAWRLVAELPSTRLLFASKSARGYQLLTGMEAPARRARDIERPRRRKALLIGCGAMAESIAHVQGNVERARGIADREGVHQMRVGIRRLRVAAGVGRKAGLPSMSDTLVDELRWLWNLLGDCRDADVFESAMWPPIAREAGDADAAAATRFDASVAKVRASLHRRLHRALDGRRFQFIMLSLARIAALQREASASTPPRRSARRLARRMLSRRAQRIVSVDIDDLPDERRHRVRIDAKKLRYLAEFVGGLYGGHRTRRYLHRLGAVQAALGSLNDVVAMERWVGKAAARLSAGDRAIIARMCDRYAAARMPALANEMAAAWRAFTKAAPFWR